MLHKRLYQFVLVYFIGLAFLFAVKGIFNLSDYVIPGLPDLYITARRVFARYFFDVLNTLSVAIVGHILSIAMATVVGIIGRL
ncbi:MAG: NitT/TauT family transport system permease protein, partial [Thermodesulfobacteriota bacterium]|nr:NitT/TauT family transport system permease protein [Thermodesulfobacteriota bacterium]